MGFTLAVVSAVILGAGDFFGGMAAKRAHVWTVVIWSNIAGLVVALVLATVVGAGGIRASDVVWGALAGLCGTASVLLLYHALATGVMSLVAPVTAAAGAAFPVVAGLLSGDRLASVAIVGLAFGIGAILLVSMGAARVPTSAQRRRRSLLLAVLAGIGIGAFFVLLAHTDRTSSLWPLVWARCASLPVLIALALHNGISFRMPKGSLRPALLSGLLDMASSALFVVAVRMGDLSTVGLLASLYPVSTVLLARMVLAERIRPVQHVGVLLAMGSIVLLALADGTR